MAVSDSTSMRPPYPAREFSLAGVAMSVVHVAGGKPTTRTAVVDIGNTTFLGKGRHSKSEYRDLHFSGSSSSPT